jgi:hypothetical protein
MPAEYVSAEVRRFVAARARGHCEYCRVPDRFVPDTFTLDHIQPRAAEGQTTLDNLAWACPGCNSHKHTTTAAADPQTGDTFPLFHPRQQRWAEHFAWSDNFLQIIGLTPCGRATIEALKLNRPELVNLRYLLVIAGLHPPSL